MITAAAFDSLRFHSQANDGDSSTKRRSCIESAACSPTCVSARRARQFCAQRGAYPETPGNQRQAKVEGAEAHAFQGFVHVKVWHHAATGGAASNIGFATGAGSIPIEGRGRRYDGCQRRHGVASTVHVQHGTRRRTSKLLSAPLGIS